MLAKPFPILLIAPIDAADAVASSGLIPRLIKEIPAARFTIVGGPDSAPLFAHVPDLAGLIIAPRYAGLGERFKLWRRLRKRKWGLIIDLAGTGLSGWLKRRRRAELKPGQLTENRTVAAARLLGFEDDPPAPFLYTSPEIEQAAEEAIGGGPVVGVGPGAAWIGRQWPPERYGQLATQLMLADDAPLGGACIVAFGGEGDRDSVQTSVFPLPRKRIVKRAYSQDYLTDYAWLKRCLLYVGGDNVWTQLAAAAGTPTVAIFGPTDETVSAPFGDHVRVVRGARDFLTLKALDPNFNQQISHLTDLPVEPAVAAARDLLSRYRDPHG